MLLFQRKPAESFSLLSLHCRRLNVASPPTALQGVAPIPTCNVNPRYFTRKARIKMATLKSNWRPIICIPKARGVFNIFVFGSVHMRARNGHGYFASLTARGSSAAAAGLFPSFLKPCRDASRRYRALWYMRDDRPGGHDKAVVEFGTRKFLGLRFALKRLGRPRAPASNCSASPRDFEGHIPSMLLHPMIPMDLPPSITSEGSVVRFAWGRTRDVACVRFWAGVMFILEPVADALPRFVAAAMTYFRLITWGAFERCKFVL